MAKYLVIVESPAKVKTIKKFLGANYDVEASNGHVRDFPKSQFGIDVEHDFEPKYITIRGKGELLAKLRKAAKKADKIYLATDPDREGEAISWHLMQALKEDPKKMHRITFNEITKTAVKSSIKQARDLDMDLVDAQQAVKQGMPCMAECALLNCISTIDTVTSGHFTEIWQKPVRELSGGMRRRVSILRALLAESDCVIMDEPLRGLDEKTRAKTIDYILKKTEGKTLIFVTHEEKEAVWLKADRTVDILTKH